MNWIFENLIAFIIAVGIVLIIFLIGSHFGLNAECQEEENGKKEESIDSSRSESKN